MLKSPERLDLDIFLFIVIRLSSCSDRKSFSFRFHSDKHIICKTTFVLVVANFSIEDDMSVFVSDIDVSSLISDDLIATT